MTTTSEPMTGTTMADISVARHEAGDTNHENALPGNLRGSATLVIQTRQAQSLLHGRTRRKNKAGIIGLNHFSRLMRAIWLAAGQDDPYADWYLIRILENIEDARAEIAQRHQELQQSLQSTRGIEIELAHSTSPARVPLRFATPYGYMGAYLLADFDELACAILTTQHVGLLSRSRAEVLIRHSARRLRRIFTIPLSWKHLAVSRDDMRRQNSLAQQARHTMGDIPDEILAGTRRARVAPVLRLSAQAGGE